jgi:hypothetical protein
VHLGESFLVPQAQQDHGELDDRTPQEVEEEYSLSDQAKVA